MSEAIRKTTRRTGVARVVLVAAMAVPAVLVAAQAAAAESWIQSDTPAPPGATIWEFSGLSCSSKTSCEAVGSQSGASGSKVLAEMRSSSGWQIWSTPEPSGAVSSAFSAISCVSAVRCMGVGDYSNGARTAPLSEVLNGGWALRPTPSPSGATTAGLDAVSCTSANACTAVGSYSDGTGNLMLAERWNGSHWTIQSVPAPPGAVDSELAGVSCTSGTACIVAGDYDNGTGTVTLAEAWNGARWTIQATPNPSGATASELDGISCASGTACTAVGLGFAESWNGTTWSLQTIAKPQGGTRPDLNRVSCTAVVTCAAVGVSYRDGVPNAAAETWNGTSWKVQAIAITTSYDSAFLDDVSCTSATTCTAVGSYHDPVDGDRALAEILNLRWQVQDAPNPASSLSSDFSDVSCPSANACTAVGNMETSTDFEPVVEGRNGGSWTIESTPSPSVSNLDGVSCTSAGACTAVGDISNGGKLITLAERWNGTSWATQSTPNPKNATRSYLIDVSCPSATACTAVGIYFNSAGTQLTFAETWDGTSWKLHSTPGPAGTTTSQLSSVSCTSPTTCTAVGYYLSPGDTLLAESWNGTSWKIEPVTNPAGDSGGLLAGVSCRSAGDCLAVGSYNDGSRDVSLSEFWNGTRWTAHGTPPLPQAKQTGLTSVSCTAGGQCTAVGFMLSHGGQVKMLAELWNGSNWGVRDTQTPPGAQASNLASASCTSAVDCTAVGYYEDSTGDDVILAEQYS